MEVAIPQESLEIWSDVMNGHNKLIHNHKKVGWYYQQTLNDIKPFALYAAARHYAMNITMVGGTYEIIGIEAYSGKKQVSYYFTSLMF